MEGTAEAPCGRRVSLITSWEEVEVLPGANRPSWKRFLPRILSLETIPQMNLSVRVCARPWLESVKVLQLQTSSPGSQHVSCQLAAMSAADVGAAGASLADGAAGAVLGGGGG